MAYGSQVAEILSLDQNGKRLIPLVSGACTSGEAQVRLRNQKASKLFVDAYAPKEALAGLWLYFSCWNECHEIAQSLETPEAYFWHAILHRQEPDAGNASYWFRRVGSHAIFPDLCRAASDVLTSHPSVEFRPGDHWDPFSFVAFCERACKQPGSPSESAALEIQRAEWQLLFDYCARPHA
jgi:hypothetical protein